MINNTKIYDDDDETYFKILKIRNCPDDKDEIKQLTIDKIEELNNKVHKLEKENLQYRNEIDILKHEIECINNGFNILVEKLIKRQ